MKTFHPASYVPEGTGKFSKFDPEAEEKRIEKVLKKLSAVSAVASTIDTDKKTKSVVGIHEAKKSGPTCLVFGRTPVKINPDFTRRDQRYYKELDRPVHGTQTPKYKTKSRQTLRKSFENIFGKPCEPYLAHDFIQDSSCFVN